MPNECEYCGRQPSVSVVNPFSPIALSESVILDKVLFALLRRKASHTKSTKRRCSWREFVSGITQLDARRWISSPTKDIWWHGEDPAPLVLKALNALIKKQVYFLGRNIHSATDWPLMPEFALVSQFSSWRSQNEKMSLVSLKKKKKNTNSETTDTGIWGTRGLLWVTHTPFN